MPSQSPCASPGSCDDFRCTLHEFRSSQLKGRLQQKELAGTRTPGQRLRLLQRWFTGACKLRIECGPLGCQLCWLHEVEIE